MDHFSIPAVDTLDLEILMHRDVHFSGQFSLMINYYKKKGVGIMMEFDLPRIKKLMKIELDEGRNLSEMVLPMSAIETVSHAKEMYLYLKASYEHEDRSKEAVLLSDLILTEEEFPSKEIQAIVQKGASMLPLLTDLLKTDYFYDPLYPGYGRSPIFAAECLAKIQDEKAIPVLFETLGRNNFFTDEAALKALASFGEKAIHFLLRRLSSKPYSKDNELAALALTSFPENEVAAKTCLQLLKDPLIHHWPTMLQYLVLACSGLSTETERKDLLNLKNKLPSLVHPDLKLLAKQWSISQ